MRAGPDHAPSSSQGEAASPAAAAAPARPAAVHKQSRQPYNPSALLAAIVREAPQFKGKQQQDAHELLHVIMNSLQV